MLFMKINSFYIVNQLTCRFNCAIINSDLAFRQVLNFVGIIKPERKYAKWVLCLNIYSFLTGK